MGGWDWNVRRGRMGIKFENLWLCPQWRMGMKGVCEGEWDWIVRGGRIAIKYESEDGGWRVANTGSVRLEDGTGLCEEG
jgi:hypothetical protein